MSSFLSSSRLSFLANLLLALLLIGLLVGCQTTPERETTETQPAPEAPPPGEEREQAPEGSAPTPDTADETAESEASAEQQPPTAQGETAEAAAPETAPEEERNSSEAESEQADPDEASSEREAALAQVDGRNAPSAGGTQASETEAGGSDGPVPEQRPNVAEVAGDAEVPQNSDARFREAMRRFDGRLARERFGTAGGDDQGRAGGDGAGGDGGESGTGAVAGAGNPFEDGQNDSERKPDATGRGGIGERNTHSPPPGTPDGRDDDIVARQLREAAETETDPELRERLWEEYRAYKNDQQ